MGRLLPVVMLADEGLLLAASGAPGSMYLDTTGGNSMYQILPRL
jgi:hypothetical protein